MTDRINWKQELLPSWFHKIIEAEMLITDPVSRGSDVLKLVYPGGFVEIHKRPVTAAEIMKRNPRHCVTRPDVFKFPWIVVRPESVLKTGRVFYVVPYYTIHRLLQSKSSTPKKYSDIGGEYDFRPRPTLGYYEVREQTQDRMQREEDLIPNLNHFHRLVEKGNACASRKKVNIECQEMSSGFSGTKYIAGNDKFYRDQSFVQSRVSFKTQKEQEVELEQWQKNFDAYENDQKSEQQTHGVYLFLANDHKVGNSPQQPTYGEAVELRSCLRKHNNVPKTRGCRVRFALDEDE